MTPTVPASGLLLVTQLPLNSQPDDNRSCYIYRVQFANINGHYKLCTIVTLVVIVVVNQLVKCVIYICCFILVTVSVKELVDTSPMHGTPKLLAMV